MPEYQDDLFNEKPPAVRGSQTSHAAATSMQGTPVDSARRLVLACVFRLGPMTDEEIANKLGMNPSTARPRRIELEKAGLLVRVGTKKTKSGRNAVLFRALRETLAPKVQVRSDKPRRPQREHA